MRRAWNLRVPSDAHRSGELTFHHNRTSLNGTGGLGLATFLIGDVTKLRRYASERTDAAERQWRHFYYAQDTWRANDKFTLNYGLRLDVINPQTINEAGNAGYLDLTTGEIKVAGVGGTSLNGDIENKLNWAPRVGATYQFNEKTVIRGGYGRSYDMGSLRVAVRSQRDPEPAGALVQDQVGTTPDFDAVFNLSQPAPPPVFLNDSDGRFPLPNNVFARALPTEQRPPTVDAFNVIVQRQLGNTMSVEAGYVGNRGRKVFAGNGPRDQHQSGDAQRVPAGRPLQSAAAVLQQIRLDPGDRLLLQLREKRV